MASVQGKRNELCLLPGSPTHFCRLHSVSVTATPYSFKPTVDFNMLKSEKIDNYGQKYTIIRQYPNLVHKPNIFLQEKVVAPTNQCVAPSSFAQNLRHGLSLSKTDSPRARISDIVTAGQREQFRFWLFLWGGGRGGSKKPTIKFSK